MKPYETIRSPVEKGGPQTPQQALKASKAVYSFVSSHTSGLGFGASGFQRGSRKGRALRALGPAELKGIVDFFWRFFRYIMRRRDTTLLSRDQIAAMHVRTSLASAQLVWAQP